MLRRKKASKSKSCEPRWVDISVNNAPWKVVKVKDLAIVSIERERLLDGASVGGKRIIALNEKLFTEDGDFSLRQTFYHELTHAILNSGFDAIEKEAIETIAESVGTNVAAISPVFEEIMSKLREMKAYKNEEFFSEFKIEC